MEHGIVLKFLSFLLFLGCGRMKVNSGRNADPSYRERAQQEERNLELNSGSCLTPRKELPMDIAGLCSDSNELAKLPRIKQTICGEMQFLGLLQPECAWNGAGAPDGHLWMIETTKLDDPGQYFYGYTVFAVSFNKSDRKFVDLLKWAHSRPQDYPYRLPKNTKITPVTPPAPNPELIRYRMDLTTEAGPTTHFTSDMQFESSTLAEAVIDKLNTDYDLRNVEMRESLILVSLEHPEKVVVLVLEEKKIFDFGIHNVAQRHLKGVDVEKMKVYLAGGLGESL